MTEAATAQEITITRVYDAPRQLVWDAWTQPDQLASWWGKRGWTTDPSTIVLDLRPGGTFRLTSVSEEDGAEMPQEGVYREVAEPERLVIEERGEGNWHDGATSVVTFTELGDGRTEMTFRSTIQTTAEMRGHAEAGVASSFDRLAEHLAEGGAMDFQLEVVQVPVSDVDRAKAFYTEKAGFHLDHDTEHGELRVVQLTPQGSACSIVCGAPPARAGGRRGAGGRRPRVPAGPGGGRARQRRVRLLQRPRRQPLGDPADQREEAIMTGTTSLVTGVDFVVVPTRNFDQAVHFYGEVLGLPCSARYERMPGAEFETGTLTLAVLELEAFGVEFSPNKSGIALRVDDVAAARAELESRGVSFNGDIVDSGVCHQGYFADPDGNNLILHHRYAPRS
jgi:uncharacterized protein YndB with AHSA1/START domain/catechol 2,3-dioxygenase-like lactoylglutathione lyase family enzyme